MIFSGRKSEGADVHQSGGESSWIIRFYEGEAPDDRGRSLRQIWRWPDEKFERVHDYIEWLFPLPEPSSFNPEAPILDEQTIREFRSSLNSAQACAAHYLRMLAF